MKNSHSTPWFIICVAVSALTFVGLFSGLLLYQKSLLIVSIIGIAMFLMRSGSKNMEFLYLIGALIISRQGLDRPDYSPLGFVGALLIVVAFIIGWIYIHRRKLPARDALIYLFILLVNILGFAVMFIGFSSQYIWFPVVGLLFLNIMLVRENNFYAGLDSIIIFVLGLAALAIGIISTIVQFWTSEIILGMDLWLVLLLLGTLAGVILTLVKVAKKIDARQRTEEERERLKALADADAKRKEAIEEEKREKQKELQDNIDDLMKKEALRVDQVVLLARNVKPNILFGKNGLAFSHEEFIEKLPLELSGISHVKRQIVWGNSLIKNLEFIESAVSTSLDDHFIELAVSKVYDFLVTVLGYKNYIGQKELFSFVLDNCSRVVICMSELSRKFPKFPEIRRKLEKC